MQESMEAREEDPTFAYDRIPYPGSAETHIHLNNLEVVTAMFGLSVPAPTQCRVLEIGCASGANLLPMASEFPNSQFIGVDPVEDRITEANSIAKQAGLENVEFRAASLSHLDQSIGDFDFILAPGVYSWVTDQEREDLLRLCSERLTPKGIAVISYNTFPGWKWSGAIRDFIRQHVDPSYTWRDQVKQARAIVDYIATHSPRSAQKTFYKQVQETFRGSHEPYLYHEYLTELNQAFYFQEFDARINQHGMKFVAEADFRQSSGFGLESTARRAVLEAPADKLQPLMDMLLNTSYRKSILCRSDCHYTPIDATALIGQYWMALGEKVPPNTIDTESPEPVNLDYQYGNLATNDRLTKLAIAKMAECWPQPIKLSDLPVAGNDLAALSQSLFALYGASFIRLFKRPPRLASEISEKPMAMPITRAMQAANQPVVSQWHHQVDGLSGLDKTLLQRLDGTVSQAQLEAEFANLGVTSDQMKQSLERLFESRVLIA